MLEARRRQQAQDDRQGVGTTLSHSLQAIDPILGPYRSAKRSSLDRIGATDIFMDMVLPDHKHSLSRRSGVLRALASPARSLFACSQKSWLFTS